MADILTHVFSSFTAQRSTAFNQSLLVGESSTSRSLLVGESSTSGSLLVGESSTSGSLLVGESSTSGSLLVGESSTSRSLLVGESSTSRSLLVGESSTSRSLLVLAALAAAADLGIQVLFLSRTQIQRLPLGVSNLRPDSLKKVRFAYPGTLDELLREIAGLHESPAGARPRLVIVDGLDGYLCAGQRGALSSAAHVSALLCDTAAFLTRSPEAPCRVLASVREGVAWEGVAWEGVAGDDALLPVLDRYFPVRCTLERDTPPGARDTWRVYLSGAGVAGGEHEGRSVSPQWRLDAHPGGSMEFSAV